MVELVGDLPPGVYRYHPREHTVVRRVDEDRRRQVGQAAAGQDWIAREPAIVAIASVDERTHTRYRDRTERYVAIEARHVGQNMLVGALEDERVADVLGLGRGERPLALMLVGKPDD